MREAWARGAAGRRGVTRGDRGGGHSPRPMASLSCGGGGCGRNNWEQMLERWLEMSNNWDFKFCSKKNLYRVLNRGLFKIGQFLWLPWRCSVFGFVKPDI